MKIINFSDNLCLTIQFLMILSLLSNEVCRPGQDAENGFSRQAFLRSLPPKQPWKESTEKPYNRKN